LSRALTAQVLDDPNLYQNLRRHWSELLRSPRKHELTASHHLLYLALLGKDWRKGFTPATNRRKLDNGAFQGWKLFRAIHGLHSTSCEADLLAPFDGLVAPAVVQRLRQIIPIQSAYNYRPEQFDKDSYPFEAYKVVPSAQAETAGDNRNTNA